MLSRQGYARLRPGGISSHDGIQRYGVIDGGVVRICSDHAAGWGFIFPIKNSSSSSYTTPGSYPYHHNRPDACALFSSSLQPVSPVVIWDSSSIFPMETETSRSFMASRFHASSLRNFFDCPHHVILSDSQPISHHLPPFRKVFARL